MDSLGKVVDRILEFTEQLLQCAPDQYPLARKYLVEVRDTINESINPHPTVDRLDAYIQDLDRRFLH